MRKGLTGLGNTSILEPFSWNSNDNRRLLYISSEASTKTHFYLSIFFLGIKNIHSICTDWIAKWFRWFYFYTSATKIDGLAFLMWTVDISFRLSFFKRTLRLDIFQAKKNIQILNNFACKWIYRMMNYDSPIIWPHLNTINISWTHMENPHWLLIHTMLFAFAIASKNNLHTSFSNDHIDVI